MIELVARLLADAYMHLRSDPRVLDPGSIRSFIAAAADAVARLALCGYSCDPVRVIEHVAVQELAHVVRTVDASYDTAVAAVREAIRKALNGEPVSEPVQDPLEALANSQLPSQREEAPIHDAVARRIAVSDVGDERVPNLATLINERVGEWASIVVKVAALRELGLSRGITISVSRLPRTRKGVTRVERFESSRTPIAPLYVREWRLGDRDVDLFKSAINIRRRIARGQPPSHRDLIVDEFGEPEPPDLVICLDVSASMNEASMGTRKIELAKQHIASLIASAGTRIGLILFNARGDILWAPTSPRNHMRHMLELLSAVYADGGTDVGSALAKAYEIARRSRRRISIMLISDGKTMSLEKALRTARRLASRRVAIHAVAVGRDADTALLRRIASMTSGSLIVIRDVSELAYALRESLRFVS